MFQSSFQACSFSLRARADWSPTARTFSPARTPRTPRRAFCPGEHRLKKFSKLARSPLEVDGRSCDLRWVQGLSLRSPMAMTRRLFEGPFGRSPGRNKLRSQAARGPCGFTHRGSRGDHPPPAYILVCAFGEQRRPTALKPLLLGKDGIQVEGDADAGRLAQVGRHGMVLPAGEHHALA